jgi:O-antigen/teichoic acid export membrane protein
LTFITAGWALLALIVIAFGPELVGAVAPMSYQNAVIIVPWVAISAVIFGMYFVMSLGLKIEKKTYLLSIVALISAIVNIGLNILLLPMIGILAAAFNTFLAYLILAILSYIFGQRFFTIPLDWARLAKILIASISTLFIIIQLGKMSILDINSLVVRTLGLFSYPVILLLMRFINLDQSKELWKLGTSLLRHKMEEA